MRWRQGTRSENVEDRRSPGGSGGGIGVPGGIVGLIVILVIGMALGINPMELLQSADLSTGSGQQQSALSEEQQVQQDKLVDFVSLVLGDTETTWSLVFRDDLGQTYQKPKLVLFSGSVHSACGMASSATGPFYCPGDQKVYLDLEFFNELSERFGAPGDFAQAYVIAHEVGHHVQTLEGTLQKVDAKMNQVSETEANKLSVALELQADCYAGLWANRASQKDLILDTGDLEEGLNAASAIGDDRLQKQAQGYVVPDSFTHGSSAQRVAWFRKGMESGRMESCDCFNTINLH